MPSYSLSENVAFVNSTLAKWLKAAGTKGWTNCLTRHSYLVDKFLQRAKIDASSGSSIEFGVALNGQDSGGWEGPNESFSLVSGTAAMTGRAYWRKCTANVYMSEVEEMLNSGSEARYDLPTLFKTQMNVSAANVLNDALTHPTGNYDHYTDTTGHVRAQGLKYAITYNGLATDGLGTTVYGIAHSNTRWRNQFITPLGTSETEFNYSNPITSIEDVRDALERMQMLCRYVSPEGFEINYVTEVGEAPDRDEYMMCSDYAFINNFRNVLFDRRDDVRTDQWMGLPTWHGMPIYFDKNLGIGSTGLWLDSNSQSYFDHSIAGRTDGLTAGAYPNSSEVYFVNLKTWKLFIHPQANPKLKEIKPTNQDGHGWRMYYLLNSVCLDRSSNGVVALFPNSRL